MNHKEESGHTEEKPGFDLKKNFCGKGNIKVQ